MRGGSCRLLLVACAWAGFNFPVLNVWAVGACLCGFEGILHSDKSGGLPA